MKHQYEDYKKWIDDELLFLDNCLDERGWESKTEKNYRASLLANKATLEGHKPKAHLIPCPDGIMGCAVAHWSQPVISPPLLDVTNQLDLVMEERNE